MSADSPETREEFLKALDAGYQAVAVCAGDLPSDGMSWEEIEAAMDAAKEADVSEMGGRLTMYSLKGSPEVQEVIGKAWAKYLGHNALFSLVMPSVFTMEAQLDHWCAQLLGGTSSARAFLTSGGTESIFSGMKSARDWANAERGEIARPEIIVPETAHAAFNKAGEILGVKVVRVPSGADHRADTAEVAARINARTIMIAGSAPSWPYGLYDDIPALAAMAQDRGIWFHTDACFGGFLAPFVRDLGYPIPPYGLDVPGVCSISADLHKYGYAAKPASIVAYPSVERSEHQLFFFNDWAEGIYPTLSFAGSRPAGAVAAAWAVMKYLGREGYLGLARRTMGVKEALTDGLNAIPGIRVRDTDLSILLYEAVELDTLAISKGLQERGHYVMGTVEPDGSEKLIHLTVDPADDDWVEAYLKDVREVAGLAARGQLTGEGAELRYV